MYSYDEVHCSMLIYIYTGLRNLLIRHVEELELGSGSLLNRPDQGFAEEMRNRR